MKIKIISLCMALVMLAGCGTGLSSSSGDPTKLVMAKTDTAEVTYEGYSLYLDVVEEFAKMTARENMAFVEMLVKDLTAEGKAPDREAFETAVTPTIKEMVDSEDMQQMLGLVFEATGLTKETLIEAAKYDYWPQAVYEEMSKHLSVKAEADKKDVMELFDEYSKSFKTRADFTNPDILVKLDGEDIPLTQVQKDYMSYSAIMARSTTIENIATRHLVIEDMKKKGIAIDTSGFAKYKEDIVAQVNQDEVYTMMFPKVLQILNVTEEEYYKELDSYLMLGYVGTDFSKMIESGYSSLPEESRPETIDEYLTDYFNTVVNNLELVNITGK